MRTILKIIGSVSGTLIAIVGVLGVFYPDKLNLQKNKLDSFYAEINTRNDVNALADFIYTHTNQVVYLGINVCRDREEDKHALPRIRRDSNSLSIDDDDDCDQDNRLLNCTSTRFNFSSDYNSSVWEWYPYFSCDKSNSSYSAVEGYFLVPSRPIFGQGNTEWNLKPISTETILLKNY